MSRYYGRFAPSPTGPLHFGSLVAAAGSYLDARHSDGEWLVRIEDVDEPRTVPGASDDILKTLTAFGFQISGTVLFQSRRRSVYAASLETLKRAGLAYPCGCSRKDFADSQRYPGTCRTGLPAGREPRAWRMRVPESLITFEDHVMGLLQESLTATSGDFVILRADGIFAYQLAVVVDDAEQSVTHVVRGADLLDSTPRQIALQQALGFPQPQYLHLPVAQNEAGEKLSKQTLAPAIDPARAAMELMRALRFLGQNPPEELVRRPLHEIWNWAIPNWDVSRIPRVLGATVL